MGGVVLLCMRGSEKRVQQFAIGWSLWPLFLLIYAHKDLLGMQLLAPWLSQLGIDFYLKIDALSLPFLYLTAIVVPISLCVVRGNNNKMALSFQFYGLVLLLEAFLIGFFTARDLVLFVVFWEAILFPLYFIILFWGGSGRQKASLKFLIYMIAGSALMVVAVLGLYFLSTTTGKGSFNLDLLTAMSIPMHYQKMLFAIFLLAFAVKTPLFPFHAWLPSSYTQAPTTGSILLAALLSKAGIYALLRIGVELFPTPLSEWSPFLAVVATCGVLYGAMAAAVQNDFKQLIAYSSLSHVNLILVGLFIWDPMAHTGAMLQAFNHGITITALFVVAQWLEDRIGSTSIGQVSGLAKYMPQLCWISLIFVLASMSLPSTNNFIGELLIFVSLFKANALLTAVLALSVIFSAIYMLRWMQKMYFEEPMPFQSSWADIGKRELLIAFPLIFLIFWAGLYPAPLLQQIEPVANKVLSTSKSGEFHE